MLVDSIICHKVAHFWLVRADPEVKPIIFVEFILQRVATNRASDLEEVYHVHIKLIRMSQMVVFDQLNKEPRWLGLRRDDINPILCPG